MKSLEQKLLDQYETYLQYVENPPDDAYTYTVSNDDTVWIKKNGEIDRLTGPTVVHERFCLWHYNKKCYYQSIVASSSPATLSFVMLFTWYDFPSRKVLMQNHTK